MINVTCANCGYSRDFDEVHRGLTFRCPTCSKPVDITERTIPPVEFLNSDSPTVVTEESDKLEISPTDSLESTSSDSLESSSSDSLESLSSHSLESSSSDTFESSPADTFQNTPTDSTKQSRGESGQKGRIVLLVLAGIVLILAAFFITRYFTDSSNKREVVDLIPIRSEDGYMYMDRNGQTIINPQFRSASVFHDDLALVHSSGEEGFWGYIAKDGSYKINPEYKQATIFSEGIAWVVSKGGAPTAIGNKGETLFVLKEAEQVSIYKEGLSAFSVLDSVGTKWGFLDKSGKVAIKPRFTGVQNFSEGVCAFMNEEGNWGYMDRSGQLIIQPQFENAAPFMGDHAVVRIGDNYGLIDKKGKLVVNPQFEEMKADGELFLIRLEGKYGWTDEDGQMIINPQFDRAGFFAGAELAPVRMDGDWGYVDKTGRLIINPQFDKALCFNGDLAMVSSGRSIGFINAEGRYVINPQKYKESEDFVRYVAFGETEYGQVETDFLDIGSLVERLQSVITSQKINDLTFSSTYSQIIQKFNLQPGYFIKTFNQQLVSTVNIGSSTKLEFYVSGYPFKQVAQSNGFYIEYSEVFDPESTPTSFTYEIKLSGKYRQKLPLVLEAVQNAFPGFAKEVNRYSPNTVTLTNDNYLINITSSDAVIMIYIYSPYMEFGH